MGIYCWMTFIQFLEFNWHFVLFSFLFILYSNLLLFRFYLKICLCFWIVLVCFTCQFYLFIFYFVTYGTMFNDYIHLNLVFTHVLKKFLNHQITMMKQEANFLNHFGKIFYNILLKIVICSFISLKAPKVKLELSKFKAYLKKNWFISIWSWHKETPFFVKFLILAVYSFDFAFSKFR